VFIYAYNGDARLEDQTTTPEFKKWFGKSAVVDETGKTLVVYHGTGRGKDFNVFGEVVEKKGYSNAHRLWYFTKDLDMANTFAGYTKQTGLYNGTSGSIMPVYLSIKNPNVLKMEDADAIEDVAYWATEKQLDEFLAKVLME